MSSRKPRKRLSGTHGDNGLDDDAVCLHSCQQTAGYAVCRRHKRSDSPRDRTQKWRNSRLHKAIRCEDAGLLRTIRGLSSSDCAREKIEALAAGLEAVSY